jgi:peroxiredoxin
MPEGWDEIPGARGCTPQNCAFRDLHEELRGRGATVLGCSSQPLDEQREFAARERMPYPLLNDSGLRLAEDPGLPTFEVEGERLYKRITLIARGGVISEVIYPVFPPGSDAAEALSLL